MYAEIDYARKATAYTISETTEPSVLVRTFWRAFEAQRYQV